MRSILAASCVLLIFFVIAHALSQEGLTYGQPSDLKGLHKVYVDTGVDTKSRDKIIKNLLKSKLGFFIVDTEPEAEITLGFGAGWVTKKAMATVVGSSVIAEDLSQRTGRGAVFARARGKDRLILTFQDTQNSKWERDPVDNFCREFLKIYKKGSEIK